MKVSAHIIKFMRLSLSMHTIVSSWGISNIEVSECTLKFYVHGFKFKGHITITEVGDLLCATFSNGLYLEETSEINLLKILDSHIEAGENYINDLLNYVNE